LTSVYVADVEPDGETTRAMRIVNSKRLTLSAYRNDPAAWTADSRSVIFASIREGPWGLSRQSLGADSVMPVSTSQEEIAGARVSPDGAWVLYMVPPTPTELLARVIRAPVAGGPSQLVMTARWSPRLVIASEFRGPISCAKAPASLCAVAEQSRDGKQLIFTAFDALGGRGREITSLDIDPGGDYVWDLSPDGTRIAILKNSEGKISILSVGREARRQIQVKGWNSLDAVAWTANGAGLLVSSRIEHASVLLYSDLQGNAQILWKHEGGMATFGIPSPDGRHLAMLGQTLNSNIWMMENF